MNQTYLDTARLLTQIAPFVLAEGSPSQAPSEAQRGGVRRIAGKIFGGLREAGLRHGNPVADAEAPQIVALAGDLLNPECAGAARC